MEAAGATLIERTADGGSMGLSALSRGPGHAASDRSHQVLGQ